MIQATECAPRLTLQRTPRGQPALSQSRGSVSAAGLLGASLSVGPPSALRSPDSQIPGRGDLTVLCNRDFYSATLSED